MQYWLDTEFTEDGVTIDLISLAIVAEDGRELYLLNYDCDWSRANAFVQTHVLPKLPERKRENVGRRDEIVGKYHKRRVIPEVVKEFCDPDVYGKPQFIAYYADYDWVAFCQLFGRMVDLPKGYPMYCWDMKQDADRLGIKLSDAVPQDVEHDALEDARWNRRAWQYLQNLEQQQQQALLDQLHEAQNSDPIRM